MKLPIPFINNKKEASDYVLALLLTDEKVIAVILVAQAGTMKMIGKHEELISEPLETLALKDLTEIVDKTISKAEEVLPPEIETHNTVFGVKENWIEPETKKITKEHLHMLKKVCDALDLSPIGFMVITEAIVHLLQEEEGAPLSAILAEVGEKRVALTLLRGGKTLEAVDGPLQGNAPATVDSLLKHFSVAVLPARILLFQTGADKKASQRFISHQWSKSLPFLHMPQITVLPAGFDAKAVTSGAATQMGYKILDTSANTLENLPTAPEASEEETIKESEEAEETKEKDLKENEETPDSFGFVVDKDVAQLKRPEAPKEKIELHNKEEEVHENVLAHNVSQNEEESDEEEMEESAPDSPGKRFAFLSALSKFKMPKLKLPSAGFANNKGMLPLILILACVILLGGGLIYYYQIHVNVILSVKPNLVNQTSDVVFSTTSPSDFSNNTIAAKSVSTSVTGDLTTPATGKKDIGDKSKGSVTVYNNSDATAELSAGTEFKSSNGLSFVLVNDITIASSSGDIFSGTKPGTTQASVTAKDIGADYNFPSGTKFTIGSNSTLAAKNDNAFSGGSKKSIIVVSKDDLVKLKADLPKNLQDKALEALSQKASSNETVLPLFTDTSLTKVTFDKNAGDEAKNVKLTATVDFTTATYNNDELAQYAQSILKNHYTQDFSFADNSVKNTIKNPKQKNDTDISAQVVIAAGLLPKINTDDIKKKIQDQSLKQATQILTSLPQVASSQITFTPNIPLLPNLFPRLPKNITVQVKANE